MQTPQQTGHTTNSFSESTGRTHSLRTSSCSMGKSVSPEKSRCDRPTLRTFESFCPLFRWTNFAI
jgi:hypothetical protein